MWNQLLTGGAVSIANFFIHAIFTGAIVFLSRHAARVTSERGMFVRMSSLLMITVTALLVAHVIEITVWAGCYGWVGLKLSDGTHFEFAFENYTALGYGATLPVDGNRLIGPVTSLNGVLLVGWSVAIIFEVLRMAELQFERLPLKHRD